MKTIVNHPGRTQIFSLFAREILFSMVSLAILPMAILFAGISSPILAGQDDPKARAIMQKVNDRDDGDHQISEMEMILIDKRKNKRLRSILSFRKDKGKDTQTIMFFKTPADVKGTGFLTYDYDESGKDDDQWLYLPALRKTKRIASDDKSGSFMGTDFNFSDMTQPDLEDYDYTLMKEVDVKGVPTWQIQAVPRSKEIADESGYSKSVVWVRKDIYMTIRVVRWVYKSRRRKYFQAKNIQKIDGIWIATELEMKTKEGKKTVHSTLLRFKNIRFNQNLKDSVFTVRRLEKGL